MSKEIQSKFCYAGRVTSKLTIVNFAFEEADLETFFLHVIAAKKLGNSYNQRGEVISLPPGKALMRTFLILMNFVFG